MTWIKKHIRVIATFTFAVLAAVLVNYLEPSADYFGIYASHPGDEVVTPWFLTPAKAQFIVFALTASLTWNMYGIVRWVPQSKVWATAMNYLNGSSSDS